MENPKTTHKIITGTAQNMQHLNDNSVDLVVTSPPYPMIEMWDNILGAQEPKIIEALVMQEPKIAFELMHLELDKVWAEVNRVLKIGGFACINIGDATRTINNEFALYSNHSRIISAFCKLGFSNLPNIIWRKQTNAPNKFMGSGMLPAGAYVTLEHEWILIFRKGGKRLFKSDQEKLNRYESALFWEERNIWFSDMWDIKGTKQIIKKSESRNRNAAFPFEIPYRLINMYSVKNDLILDPFLGTGTTTIAAIATQRNSIGYEIDKHFIELIRDNIIKTSIEFYNSYIEKRLNQHQRFIMDRNADLKIKEIKHYNVHFDIPVMTLQEKNITFSSVKNVSSLKDSTFIAEYKDSKIKFIS